MQRPFIRDNQNLFNGGPVNMIQNKHQKIELITLLDKCTQICKDDRLILRNLVKENHSEVIQLLFKHKRNTDMLILQSNLRKIVNKFKNKKGEPKQYITLPPSNSFIKLPTNNTSFDTSGIFNRKAKRSISPMIKNYSSNNSSNILTNQTYQTTQTRDPLSQLHNCSSTTINRSASSNYILGNRSMSNIIIGKGKRIPSKEKVKNQDENQNNSYIFNTSSFIQNPCNFSNLGNEQQMGNLENKKMSNKINRIPSQQSQQFPNQNLQFQTHHSHQFSNASIIAQQNQNNMYGNQTINTIQNDNSQNISYTNLNTTNLNFYQEMADGNYQFNFSGRTSLNGGSMLNNCNNQIPLNQQNQYQQQEQQEIMQQQNDISQQNMFYLQQQTANLIQQNNDSFPYFTQNNNQNYNQNFTNISNNNNNNNKNTCSQLDIHTLTLGQNQLQLYNQNQQSNQEEVCLNQPLSSKSNRSVQMHNFTNHANQCQDNENNILKTNKFSRSSSPHNGQIQNFQVGKSPEFQNVIEEDRIIQIQEVQKRSFLQSSQNQLFQQQDVNRQSKNSHRYVNNGSIGEQYQNSISQLQNNQRDDQFYNFSNNRQSNQSNNLETSLTTNNNINEQAENERIQECFDENLNIKEDRPLKVNAILNNYQAQQKISNQNNYQQNDQIQRSSRNNYSDSKRDQSIPEYSPFRQNQLIAKNQQSQRNNYQQNEEDELVDAESVFQNSEQKYFLSAKKILSQKKLLEQTLRRSQTKNDESKNAVDANNQNNMISNQKEYKIPTERKCSEFNYDDQSDQKRFQENCYMDTLLRESRNNRLSEQDEDIVKRAKMQRDLSCNISNSKKIETFNPPTAGSCINLDDRLMSSNKKQNLNYFGFNNTNVNTNFNLEQLLKQSNQNNQLLNQYEKQDINDYGSSNNKIDICNISGYSNNLYATSPYKSALNNTSKNYFINPNNVNVNLWNFDNSTTKSNSGYSVAHSLERRGLFGNQQELSIEKKVVQPYVTFKQENVFTSPDFIRRMTQGINTKELEKQISQNLVIPPPPPAISINPSPLTSNGTTSTITTTTTTTTIIKNTLVSTNNQNLSSNLNTNQVSSRSSSTCLTTPTATTLPYTIPPLKNPLVITSQSNPIYKQELTALNTLSPSYNSNNQILFFNSAFGVSATNQQINRCSSLKKEHSDLLTNWDELFKPTGIKKTQSFLENVSPVSISNKSDNGLTDNLKTDTPYGGSNIINANNFGQNQLASNYFNPLSTDYTSRSNINTYPIHTTNNNINIVCQYNQPEDEKNLSYNQMKNSNQVVSQSQQLFSRKENNNEFSSKNIFLDAANSSRFDVLRDDLNINSLNKKDTSIDYINQISTQKYQCQSPQVSIHNGISTNYNAKQNDESFKKKENTIADRYAQETPIEESDNNNDELMKGYQNNSNNKSSRVNTSIDNSRWNRQNYHLQDSNISPSALTSKSQRIKNIRESCEQLYENGIQMQNTLQNMKNSAISQLQKSLDASQLALLKQTNNSEQKSSHILRTSNNLNRESQSFIGLKQLQKEQNKTPNKSNRTQSESSHTTPNKENEKEYLIETNAKTEYEISDSKPFKFSQTNYNNIMRRISNNMIQGQQDYEMNIANLQNIQPNNILENNTNILNYAVLQGQVGSESGLNPLDIQSTTKRETNHLNANQGNQYNSQNQIYEAEEAVQDNNSQIQQQSNRLSDNNSGSMNYCSNQQYFDQNNYYFNDIPSSDVFYNYKNQVDAIREEQDNENRIPNLNENSQQGEEDNTDLYELEQQKQFEQMKFQEDYQSNQKSLDQEQQEIYSLKQSENEQNENYNQFLLNITEQLSSNQIFTEEKRNFFSEKLKLDQFTCEEIFDEIFADSNLNKISRAFFRFKIEQLLSTCDGNHSSRDECNSNTSVDSQNVDCFFDIINFKRDGFLDVNELGFSLQQICQQQSQNQVKSALDYLKERLGINRSFVTCQDIAGIFNNQDEYQEFMQCVDSSQKGFFTYWDLYLNKNKYPCQRFIQALLL
ncbi:hypothetical protein ABPG72_002090 [Tetrahymena utriculariae]